MNTHFQRIKTYWFVADQRSEQHSLLRFLISLLSGDVSRISNHSVERMLLGDEGIDLREELKCKSIYKFKTISNYSTPPAPHLLATKQ